MRPPEPQILVRSPSKLLARAPLFLVLSVFAIANVATYAAGVRPDLTPLDGRNGLDDLWQLLDLRLLQHELLSSLWHLQSQPPLFNLYAGILLKLGVVRTPTFVLTAVAFGLLLVVSSYQLLLELGVPRWPSSIVVSLFVAGSPATVLYENWFMYALPTAALLVAAAWSLARFLRTEYLGLAAAFFVCICSVALLNSSYQWLWLIVVVSLLFLGRRRDWRVLAAVAALPLLLVAGWYLKNAVMFGTYTTSSWLGMNLAKATIFEAPRAQVRHLEEMGTLTPLASINPFSPPGAYHRPLPHTGTPALDQTTKSDGVSNFNNAVYVGVSNQYLHDDLAYITAAPGSYFGHVINAVTLWMVPSEQYSSTYAGRRDIAGYADSYDRWVLWQPYPDAKATLYAVFYKRLPGPSQISYLTMAALTISLVGGPVIAWRRRRDPAFATTIFYLWFTTTYAFVTASLVEFGENQRFAFELGPLPIVLATTVVSSLFVPGVSRPLRVASHRSHRSLGRAGTPTSPAA